MQDVCPSDVELCLRAAANTVVAAAMVWSSHRLRAMDRDQMQDRLGTLDASGREAVTRLVRSLHGGAMSAGDRTDLFRVGSLFAHAVDRLATAGRIARDYGLVALSEEVWVLIDLVVDCAWITAQSLAPLEVSAPVRPYWIELAEVAGRGDRAYEVLLARHLVDSIFSSGHGAIRAIGAEVRAAVHNLAAAPHTVEFLRARPGGALVSP